MFSIVMPSAQPMSMDDMPDEYRLEALTREIHSLRNERRFLQSEADLAADDARVLLAKAQDAQKAVHENAQQLKELKSKAANLRLEQAEEGLKWQQGRVDQYKEVVDSLPPVPESDSSDDEIDAVDEEAGDVAPFSPPSPPPKPKKQSVDNLEVWRTRSGVNCANVDNSFVLSSRTYGASEQGEMKCVRECDQRANDPNEMFRCSHIVWNRETNTCTQFASLNIADPSPVDTNNAQVCVRAPNVTTSVAPGVPCVGCKR